MQKLYAVIVHGIGVTKAGYAKPLIDALTSKFNQRLQETHKSNDDYSDELVIQEVLWDDIVFARQEELASLLKKGFRVHRSKGLRAFFSKIFFFITLPIFRLRTDVAAEYVEDILGYSTKTGAYQKIHERILNVLNGLNKSDQKAPLSVISHSLGTVISSDFVYDRKKEKKFVHDKFILSNFFTLGSPIALFALRYGRKDFSTPIHMEEQKGEWVNIFDLDDPIAYPLKNLNSAYDKAVAKDQAVNTGGFGVSHTRYFENGQVQDIIVEKLVEDWMRLKTSSNPSHR